jgi:hypothetical protein
VRDKKRQRRLATGGRAEEQEKANLAEGEACHYRRSEADRAHQALRNDGAEKPADAADTTMQS